MVPDSHSQLPAAAQAPPRTLAQRSLLLSSWSSPNTPDRALYSPAPALLTPPPHCPTRPPTAAAGKGDAAASQPCLQLAGRHPGGAALVGRRPAARGARRAAALQQQQQQLAGPPAHGEAASVRTADCAGLPVASVCLLVAVRRDPCLPVPCCLIASRPPCAAAPCLALLRSPCAHNPLR